MQILTVAIILFLAVFAFAGCGGGGSSAYIVDYNGNGNTSGSAPVDTTNYEQGQTVTVLGAGSLVKTGYAFSGWNTQPDGSGTGYTVGQTFAMGAFHITLYAMWLEKTLNKIYVSTGGSDANPGTIPEPKLSIQNAINAATAPCEVYVAGGTYQITSQIAMKEGVSILGGYSSDFVARDPAVYPTIITDTRTPSSGKIYAIYSSGISNTVSIDGFTINCGYAVNPGSSYGIYNISSSPTITNNIINGGSGMVANGIHNESSMPTISNNTIRGGTGDSSAGIYNVSSHSIIMNNSISGGGGGGLSYGIYNQFSSNSYIMNNTILGGTGWYSHGIFNEKSSSPAIINNTINGGSGKWYSIGIQMSENSSPTITNNAIFTVGIGVRYGIKEAHLLTVHSDPALVRNNAIFDCPDALYRDEESINITDTNSNISTGEGSQTLSAWGNINEGSTVMFVDFAGGDWRLRNDAPLNIRGGGVAITGVTTDKDGLARTTSAPAGMTNTGAAGWSIGAYENDN